VGYFVSGAREYRAYAGATGAEGLFGSNTAAAWSVSAGFILVWLAMVWYALRHAQWERGHLWVLAYAFVLQTLVLPSHTYNLLFAVPLLLLVAHDLFVRFAAGRDRTTFVLLGVWVLTVYLASYYWIGILEEVGSGTLGTLLRAWLPGGVIYMP